MEGYHYFSLVIVKNPMDRGEEGSYKQRSLKKHKVRNNSSELPVE